MLHVSCFLAVGVALIATSLAWSEGIEHLPVLPCFVLLELLFSLGGVGGEGGWGIEVCNVICYLLINAISS